MFVKRLLQLNLIVSAIIALTYILLPGPTLALYGIGNDSAAISIAQYFGTAHVTFAVLVWIALRSGQPSFLRALVVSFFAGDAIGTIVLLATELRGNMNPMGWGLVGLSALFALGYGYCVLRRLPTSA